MSNKTLTFKPPYVCLPLGEDFVKVTNDYHNTVLNSQNMLTYAYNSVFNGESFIYIPDVNIYIPPENNLSVKELLYRPSKKINFNDFDTNILEGRYFIKPSSYTTPVSDKPPYYMGVYTAERNNTNLVGWVTDKKFHTHLRGKDIEIQYVFNTGSDYYTVDETDPIEFLYEDFVKDYGSNIYGCFSAINKFYVAYDDKFGRPPTHDVHLNTIFKKFYDKL